jgi:hypothetical protein
VFKLVARRAFRPVLYHSFTLLDATISTPVPQISFTTTSPHRTAAGAAANNAFWHSNSFDFGISLRNHRQLESFAPVSLTVEVSIRPAKCARSWRIPSPLASVSCYNKSVGHPQR